MIELVGGLFLAVLALLAKVKWDSNKIDNLEQENKGHEIKNEIIEDMGLAEIQAEVKRDEALKDNDGANWRDSI